MGTTEIRKKHSGQKEMSEQSHEAATLNLHETVWGEARLRNREQGEDRPPPNDGIAYAAF